SHWRRGLAAYYAGQHEVAARQFETCFGEDDVDRENGIWRYFAQRKLLGEKAAQQKLLQYRKEDRPPLPIIYDRLKGRVSDQQILDSVEKSAVQGSRLEAQRFYADLYVGIFAKL